MSSYDELKDLLDLLPVTDKAKKAANPYEKIFQRAETGSQLDKVWSGLVQDQLGSESNELAQDDLTPDSSL